MWNNVFFNENIRLKPVHFSKGKLGGKWKEVVRRK